MYVRNDTDNTYPIGGKKMKNIMVVFIVVSTLIIAGVLYGTSSLNVGEEAAVSLEQAYMAQYPKTMPNIVFDQIPTNIPF
jgi:hypothetical protein